MYALEDPARLVEVRLAGEDRLAVVHLGNDAAANEFLSSVPLLLRKGHETHPTPHMSTGVW